MGRTLGIHWAITTYGNWLHGDRRGSWLAGTMLGADPLLEAAARASMTHDSVMLDTSERDLVAGTIGSAVLEHNYQILAATIQATHMHLVFAPLRVNVKRVIAQLKYRTASAVLAKRRRRKQLAPRSLWTTGRFPVFIFGEKHLANAIEYVRDHNRREGLPPDPFDWIDPLYTPRDFLGERFQNSSREGSLFV